MTLLPTSVTAVSHLVVPGVDESLLCVCPRDVCELVLTFPRNPRRFVPTYRKLQIQLDEVHETVLYTLSHMLVSFFLSSLHRPCMLEFWSEINSVNSVNSEL